MAHTVSDYMVNRLKQWGVRRIYGFPGDGINGLLGALQRQADGADAISFIQARHEEMAAFMACAHAKFTGEVGFCMATSGPGAIHLLNGLYDAKMDHQPVVAIVGQTARFSMGADYQQEVDLGALFKDVAHEYVHTVMDPMQARTLVDRAIRVALAERTVTCIIFPKDVQELAMEEPDGQHGIALTGIGFRSPRVIPLDEDLQRAADVLNAGERVAILVGAGAMQAQNEVMAVADLLGAGVAKALLGRAVLSDDLPYVTGPIGLLGSKPSWDMMQGCDTLLMIGSSFPYSEFLPPEGQARGVQIDIDGRMLSLRYPMEVNLTGDAKETLQALLPLLRQKRDRAWRQRLEGEIRDWWQLVGARANIAADPLNPQKVFSELSPQLPGDAIITCDSGTAANWFARNLQIKRGMLASLSGNLATMGSGMPYAIGAKFAFPGRPVIALCGDGAMQMNGMNELLTVAKYWEEWDDPRFVVLVLNNRDLNQVTWEMRAMEGNPTFEASQDIPDFPFARYAELIGLRGLRVDAPDRAAEAWQEALSSDCPVVYEAYVDPDVPPLPPHISFDQAKSYMSALLKGDAHALGIMKQSAKGLAVSFFPSLAPKPTPRR